MADFHSFDSRTFQSTLPARGATRAERSPLIFSSNFNPRSPHGERPITETGAKYNSYISIHAPRTGSDKKLVTGFPVATNISIHAPRTGSDSILLLIFVKIIISIHAPRTGSDQTAPTFGKPILDFNPRSPHGERPCCIVCFFVLRLFQSTLPARGATTFPARPTSRPATFQSTLPARGATRAAAMRTGRHTLFQSTLPARGATQYQVLRGNRVVTISINAPRTGSDGIAYFAIEAFAISIHAPRTGSDNVQPLLLGNQTDFNPRSPHGERPQPRWFAICNLIISIHAPRTGSDDRDCLPARLFS